MFTTISESFIAIGWTVRALVGKVQHRVLRLIQCLIFSKFSKPPRACYSNLWKLHRNRMNGVCSYMGDKHTQTMIFIYIKLPKPPRACLQQLLKVSSQSDERYVLLYGTHTHTKTLIFIYRLNFQNHRKHVYNNFWKLHRNRRTVCAPVRQHRVLQLVQF